MSSVYESLTGSVDLPFPEYDNPPPSPMGLAKQWTDHAREVGVREPMSLALSTVDGEGRLSSRICQIIEVAEGGLLFTTHSTSRKGREIAESGRATGLFYWRETGQQLCVSGPVVQLDDAAHDKWWMARDHRLHTMTVASRQSDVLDDPAALLTEERRQAEIAGGGPLPRPDRFVAYQLQPESVEFWNAAASRLHRRLRYEKQDGGTWNVVKLEP
ncbi:pyridoxal 5'-phosphate synthase [Streptomyces sp. NA04227]|uniref:phenazine biosynthesis FMN-dependent oxidase PhzG n=1 Tax=Streptomyces sp. NA04227 TaxID=2742136 RepID=UPI001161CA77|nr:phenazine biosynthesis FMN-dependent oxidase PhzG [Streptomyces sp. NA04227]QDJ94212.1 SpzG [Streptomyces sp.]QKW08095.1 pyridoxal 5'-phosphate synthase [Streptomyces sp. NA04227]